MPEKSEQIHGTEKGRNFSKTFCDKEIVLMFKGLWSQQQDFFKKKCNHWLMLQAVIYRLF